MNKDTIIKIKELIQEDDTISDGRAEAIYDLLE